LLPISQSQKHSAVSFSLLDYLLVAIVFGILTGLVEGAGLMLFQRVNWHSWGPMIHVSTPILWISPLCDAILFSVLALIGSFLACVIQRCRVTRALMFLFSSLAAYDFLTVTARLYHWSCLLLAVGVGVAFVRWASSRQERVLRFCRRGAPWALVALVLTLIAVRGSSWLVERNEVARLPEAAAGTPNVVVIVADTLRADHLSSYGYSRPTSPNVDLLAKEGTLFENAISTCSWSLPSHVSLVTGLYQFQHGVTNVQPMPIFGSSSPSFGGKMTLGEALEKRGYRAGAFSANRTWFSHNLGFGRGFIHFEDYFHSPADMWVRTLFGREFSRIYLSRSDRSKPKRLLRWLGFHALLDKDDEGVGAGGGAPGVRKRASEVNREVLSWVGSGQRPFFVFLNYFDVHEPYGGPYDFQKPWSGATAEDQYDDSIKYVDDSIGQFMAELDKRGLSQNTVVVITADHGEGLGQHGLPTHGDALYREQIHVPLIFWYPGHVPSGMRVSTNVTNAGIGATLLTLIDLNKDSEFPGPALNSLWRQSSETVRWPNPIAELAQDGYLPRQNQRPENEVPTARTGSMRTMIEGRWQIIEHTKFGFQLYDWKRDPRELENASTSFEGQKITRELVPQLKEPMPAGGIK
jgi:arylsulfatase A-like enzyme